ncbi:MAG: hypothetical protein IJ011_09625 [Clostridia bacterium]|nr:hypothetical protein [Clostridia bacterium]
MKKLIALLLCLIMILSLFSCELNENQNDLLSNENSGSSDLNNDNVNDDNVTPPASEAEIAMKMYESVINDEICVFDERLGEIKLKACHFPSDNIMLDECKLLTKAILDVDQDGVNEYVIKSPNHEYIILRYHNGKVYSYCLNIGDFSKFNTDGTFHWYDSSEAEGWKCGLNKIIFDGETLNIRSIYSLKYSKNPTKYEHFVEGEAVTGDEYDTYRNNIRYERMKFSQFELTPLYPITAEQAWNLANEYWDNQDGSTEVSAGTIWTVRIVLIDTPNSDTDHYRFAFNVEWSSNGAGVGDECRPPYSVNSHDQILVNAFTGEITASTYNTDGKVLSVDEAIEIVKNKFFDEDIHNEEDGYRFVHDVNAVAPDHIYVIVIQKVVGRQPVLYTREWIDKYSGEIISGYYLYGGKG